MGKNIAKVTTTFEFCDGGSCRKAQSELAVREARATLRNNGLWNDTHTIRTRCNGRCEDAPTWIVQPGNYWYKNVTPEKSIAIINAHTKDDKPVEEYLLYQNEWEDLRSDNERSSKRPVFISKEDAQYGKALIARAPASDQYIYPLAQFLFTQSISFGIQFPNQEIQVIENKHTVCYTDSYDLEIEGIAANFKIAIGPITKADEKTVDTAVLDRKVGVSEVLWLQKNSIFTKAIRLKNRKGKHVVTFWIRDEDITTWEYILRIYLDMDPINPRIERES